MASILIPSRFCGPAPADYFLHPDGWMMSMDEWMYGPGYNPFYTHGRCRFPVQSSAGPMRRRSDLQRLLRESVLGEIVAPVRASRQRECGDSPFGIPAGYIRLIEHLTRGSTRETEHQCPSNRKSEGKKVEMSTEGQKAGNEQSCDRPCHAACNQTSTPENVTMGTSQPSSSSSSASRIEAQKSDTKVAKPDDVTPADNPFTLSIKIGDYQPENVNVIVDGRKVTVKARRDQRDDNESWVRHSEVEYSFLIPENTDTESLTSSFGTDDMLSITATRKGDSEKEITAPITEGRSEQTTEVSGESAADDTEEHHRDSAVNDNRVETEVDGKKTSDQKDTDNGEESEKDVDAANDL